MRDGVGRDGPSLACRGLGPKVSIGLGPPDIQSTMHAFRRLESVPAPAARFSSHPEAEPPRAPAAPRWNNCRRVRRGIDDDERSMATPPRSVKAPRDAG